MEKGVCWLDLLTFFCELQNLRNYFGYTFLIPRKLHGDKVLSYISRLLGSINLVGLIYFVFFLQHEHNFFGEKYRTC